MTSTGEVAGFGRNHYEAFIKAFWGTGGVPRIVNKTLLITIHKEKYLQELDGCIAELRQNNWNITFTHLGNDINSTKSNSDKIEKVKEEIKNKKYELVVNIPSRREGSCGFIWRRACLDFKIPVITNIKKAKTLLLSLCRTEGPFTICNEIDIL